MKDPQQLHLSRRERQIMDVIYLRGQATAYDVLDGMPNPPSYSAVRAFLAILERKGHVKHGKVGAKYIYAPTRSRQRAAQAALRNLAQTFFEGSAEKTMAALLTMSDSKISQEELDTIAGRIKELKKQKTGSSRAASKRSVTPQSKRASC